MRNCVTHHHACDCREELFEKIRTKGELLEAENAQLRHHLAELSKVADSAALVLATLEAENSDEEEQIQQIIDGISTWGPPAMLGKVTANV